jgi:hypothetical protein
LLDHWIARWTHAILQVENMYVTKTEKRYRPVRARLPTACWLPRSRELKFGTPVPGQL